jgi:F-type H+-transporting ATPase subunit b
MYQYQDEPLTPAEQAELPQNETLAEVSAAMDEDYAPVFYLDTNFWVLLAFLIIVFVAFRQGLHKMAGSFFTNRASTVRNQLDEARSLREDAQRILADYQKRQREAEDEAQGIIDQAKRDAKLMATEARQKLDEQLARRRKAAEERISRAEAQAIAEMRGKTADLAVAAAREIIAGRVDDRAQTALIDKSIANVRGRLN